MGKLLKIIYFVLALAAFALVGIALGLRVAPKAGLSDSSSFKVSTTLSHDPIAIASQAIADAESSIVVSSLMINSRDILLALQAANRRGIDISILISSPSTEQHQSLFRLLRDGRIGTVYITESRNFATFISIDGKLTLSFSAPIDENMFRDPHKTTIVGFELNLSESASRGYYTLFDTLISDARKAFG
jgi:hypothetical protein